MSSGEGLFSLKNLSFNTICSDAIFLLLDSFNLTHLFGTNTKLPLFVLKMGFYSLRSTGCSEQEHTLLGQHSQFISMKRANKKHGKVLQYQIKYLDNL